MGGSSGVSVQDILLYANPMTAPFKLAADTGAAKPIGQAGGAAAGAVADTALTLTDDLGLTKKPKPLAPPPQGMTDAQKKAQRDAAMREEEISILKDRPGRGGTILTSNYGLKL